MVNPSGRSAASAALALVLTAAALPTPTATADVIAAAPGSAPSPARDEAREALRSQGYPWYDARSDRVVPVLPEPDWEGGWLKSVGDRLAALFRPIREWFGSFRGWGLPGVGRGAGDLFFTGLAVLVVSVLMVLLLEFLRRYRAPERDPAVAAARRAGEALRIEGLPVGREMDLSDPLAMARRLRESGDHGGAIVYLFAHQLLTLSRLGLLRLTPGRTGRQLVRSVEDRRLRLPVEPTLRLFEAVYYGRRVPSEAAADAVWREAESFEREVRSRAGGALS